MTRIVAISFNQKAVGKLISGSKECLTWIVQLDGVEYDICLTLSLMTRHYEISVNGVIHKEGSEIFGDISYTIELKGCFFEIKSDFKKTTLKIDGTKFKDFRSKKNTSAHGRRYTDCTNTMASNRRDAYSPRTFILLIMINFI